MTVGLCLCVTFSLEVLKRKLKKKIPCYLRFSCSECQIIPPISVLRELDNLDKGGGMMNKEVIIKVIETGLLNAHRLPKYKVNPFEVWYKIYELSGKDIRHPLDTYTVDEFILDQVAESYIVSAKHWLTLVGFATGLPGGLVGLGLSSADIEEYVRTLYRLAQALGYTYGVLPNPLIKDLDLKSADYMNYVAGDILKIMIMGLGVSAVSISIVEGAKKFAEKEAKEILTKRVSDKIITRLAKQIAKLLGVRVTKGTVSKLVSRVIPVVGGGVSATLNYKAIGELGEKVQCSLKRERKKFKKYMIDKGLLPPDG